MPGPAKLINKLLEQTKADAKLKAELAAKLARAEADKTAAVAQARIQAKADSDARLAQLNERHAEEMAKVQDKHAADWKQASTERDALLKQIGELKARVTELREQRDAAEEERDNLRTIKDHQAGQLTFLQQQLDTLRPELTLMTVKETELKALVARIEERGRKREAEEARAILNRKAITSAIPSPNRR